MPNYIQQLEKLGLSKKEARLYLVALEAGPSTIANLAQKSGVKRGTIYEFLNTMIDKGLLEVEISGKRKLYKGVNPKKLERIIDRQKDILNSIAPELSLLISGSTQKPKIRFYEGKSGVLSAYYEILDIPNNSEVLGYGTFEGIYSKFSEKDINEYIKKRIAKGIKERLIMPTDQYADSHIAENKNEFRETILVPKEKFSITNEINIFENKVAIMSLGDELIGIIMESKQIADTQRSIFNLLWESLKSK